MASAKTNPIISILGFILGFALVVIAFAWIYRVIFGRQGDGFTCCPYYPFCRCMRNRTLVTGPEEEGFTSGGQTLYGAPENKPSGACCKFNAECASDICRHYTTPAGPQFTCM